MACLTLPREVQRKVTSRKASSNHLNLLSSFFLPKKLRRTANMALDCQNGKPHIAVASIFEKMATLQQVTCAVVNCEVNVPSKGGCSHGINMTPRYPKYMPRVTRFMAAGGKLLEVSMTFLT